MKAEEPGTSTSIVLDMSGVQFIDSMGMHVLMVVHRRLHAEGRSLILRDISAPTRRLLDLTRLDEVLDVDQTS